jgi:hypothetical protein
MRKTISASLAFLLVAAPALARPTPVAEVERIAALEPTGEARRCLRVADVQESRPIGKTMLLVREGANRWHRMTFKSPCTPLDPDRIVSYRSPTGQVCAGDLVDVTDPISRIRFPACVLGPFEPVNPEAVAAR